MIRLRAIPETCLCSKSKNNWPGNNIMGVCVGVCLREKCERKRDNSHISHISCHFKTFLSFRLFLSFGFAHFRHYSMLLPHISYTSHFRIRCCSLVFEYMLALSFLKNLNVYDIPCPLTARCKWFSLLKDDNLKRLSSNIWNTFKIYRFPPQYFLCLIITKKTSKLPNDLTPKSCWDY